VDLIPIQLDRAGSYSLHAGIDAAHTVRLLDSAGNLVASVTGAGDVAPTLAAGRYLLELRSGAAPGRKPEPIFFQMGSATGLATNQTTAVQGKTSWLLNTKNCAGCDLTQADVSGADLSGADLQDATFY